MRSLAIRRPGTSLLGLLLATALAVGLVVAVPGDGADAQTTGCFPAGGAQQPFTTSQAVKDSGADIAINGGGWGHGLGMSQYGARGAALLGCNHDQILTTYFPGTKVGNTNAVSNVRVGLVQKHSYGELTAESGPVTWKLVDCEGDPSCATVTGANPIPQQPKGATWRISSKADGTFVITQVNGTPGVRWEGGDRFSLLLAPHEGTVVKVAIQEGGSIAQRRVRHGYTEFDSYADEGGRIYAIQNITDAPDGSARAMERYLWGLAEVPASWPKETLKAQAIAGRSYAKKRIDNGARQAACRCHLYATTSDQYWAGEAREEGDVSGSWKQAVDSTEDRVLLYEGTIADTYYSSSHGGSSDDSDHVWSASVPYIKAVDTSRWETAPGVNNPYQRWSVGFTYDQLARKYGWAVFKSIEVVTRGPGGHPTRKDLNGDGQPDGVKLTGYDSAGREVTRWLSGEQIRFSSTGLGLRSSLIEIEVLRAPGASPSPSPSPSPSEPATDAGRTGPTTDMACPPGEVPDAGFADVAPGSHHEPTIDCVVWWEVAQGRGDGTYGPVDPVRRDQMASFIARSLEAAGVVLPAEPQDHFDDDEGSTHELAIDQLAELGIVAGTDVEARRYSPSWTVSRGQMAAFLVRAYEHVRGGRELPSGGDRFSDDDGTTHEVAIDKARTAWLATGRTEDRYEPQAPVLRQEMATFLARLLDAFTGEEYAAPPS